MRGERVGVERTPKIDREKKPKWTQEGQNGIRGGLSGGTVSCEQGSSLTVFELEE